MPPPPQLLESTYAPDLIHAKNMLKPGFFFRIPDELLLKYTKADSLCQDDYQVERNVSPGKKNAKMHCGPKS